MLNGCTSSAPILQGGVYTVLSAQHLFTHNCELRGCALIDSVHVKFKGTQYKYKVQILSSIMRDTSNLIQEYEGQNLFSLINYMHIYMTCTLVQC